MDAPPEGLARHGVEQDFHFVAGFDVADLVLTQIGGDPRSARIEEGHYGRARRRELTDGKLQVGDDATGRRGDGRIEKVELRLLQLELRRHDLRI